MKDIERICKYFNKFYGQYKVPNSLWNDIVKNVPPHIICPNKKMDNYIYQNQTFKFFIDNKYSECNNILENINETNLSWGYDTNSTMWKDIKTTTLDNTCLLALLKKMDIEPIYTNGTLDMEKLFPFLDKKCGFKIEFPLIYKYSGNLAYKTSRGLITQRNLFALYYIWSIVSSFYTIKDISVLEIGAGTGYTAFWAYKFGFKSYTMVDIIETGIVQAHYNFNILSSENVKLYGEPFSNRFLTIIPASEFNNISDTFDIVVNFDGITEYGIDTANNYLVRSMKITSRFLSINHTSNSYSFKDLYKKLPNIKLLLQEKDNYRTDSTYIRELIQFIK